MKKLVQDYLSELEFGQAQTYHNMTVKPIISPSGSRLHYMVMPEAVEEGLLTVTEVSKGGRVPELKVKNESDTSVLMLDGEEVAGAKQNRVFNTSILAPENSDITVPVSCTERGRWNWRSERFRDSGNVMTPRQRTHKVRSVSTSLEERQEFRSDQSEVWADVDELAQETGTHSPTGAMRESYQERRGDLEDYLEAFQPVNQQTGLLVFIGGRKVGFDVLSRPEAYTKVHSKLVSSYAMQALVSGEPKTHEVSDEKAAAFISEATQCEEKEFPSVGCGTDCRYESDHMVGSALISSGEVVHCAFFRKE
jgi:hypothetical protein